MANCKQMLIEGGGKTETPKVRDERIDSVKYWLIVLVIAGHVLEKFIDVPECEVIHDWIYLFHMPLFIFISGYFSQKKNNKDFKASIWKLAEPLILFHGIGIFIEFIKDGFIPYSRLLTPWWVTWYLLSLIYWRLILQFIPDRLLFKTKLILSISFGICIIGIVLPFTFFLSISRTLIYTPFFFLGYYMKDKNLFVLSKHKLMCLTFLIITFVMQLLHSQYLCNFTSLGVYEIFYDVIKKIFILCLSFPMSLAFVNICLNSPWIAKQGRMTMQYYIYHPFLVIIIMKFSASMNISMSLFTAIIYIIIITLGIGIMSYLPYFNSFTNPSTFIYRNKRMSHL